jgi:serine/threonine protein kinase
MGSQDIFCSNCGASNEQKAEYCFACGSSPINVDQSPGSGAETITGQKSLLQQRYKLLEKVGEGGFSTVYKAEDESTQQIVAIKAIYLQGLTVQEKIEATDAFNREVQMLSKLEHKHLPRLYDHFSDTECWYMVMDFIAGTTLEKRMERRKGTPLPIEEVFDIGLILCSVLAYLHSHRPAIIFRDLKPANIILTRDGHLFLIDFGIARHYKHGQTRDTIPFGSPGYAAPEQYGKAQTTPLADIYSLGAILHQLLSGDDPSQTPFNFAPLLDQQHPERAALHALIQRMVHTNPLQRPNDISIVKHELQMVATQYTSQRGLYSSKTPLAFPYRNLVPLAPLSPQPPQASSIWSTAVQPAVANAAMAGQLRLVQSYPYSHGQRKQQQQSNTKINGYALASLISGLLGVFVPLFLCSAVSANIEAHGPSALIVFLAILLLLPSTMSVVFGYIGRHEARKQPGKRSGIDVANAGITLGYAFGTIYLLFLLFILLFAWAAR